MISTIKCQLTDKSYVLFADEQDHEMDMFVTNGISVWRSDGKISGASKPTSRRNEPDDEYMEKLNMAIQGMEQFSFELSVSVNEEECIMIAKERIGGTSTQTLLLKTKLMTVVPSSATISPIMILLQSIGHSMSIKANSILSLKASSLQNKRLIETLCNDMEALTAAKEALQTQMIQKMCIVLNTKKAEIRRLRSAVVDLEQQLARQPSQRIEEVVEKSSKRKPSADVRKKATSVDAMQGRARRTQQRKQKPKESSDEDESEASHDLPEVLLTNSSEVSSKDIMQFLSQSQRQVNPSQVESVPPSQSQAMSSPSQSLWRPQSISQMADNVSWIGGSSQHQSSINMAPTSSSSAAHGVATELSVATTIGTTATSSSIPPQRKKRSAILLEDSDDENNCLSYI